MPEGKCPKCGAHYYGWALTLPRQQTCDKCGTALEIIEDGRKPDKGHPPLSAQTYIIKPPPTSTSPQDKD
jgi:uncharacterized OB-fold protein